MSESAWEQASVVKRKRKRRKIALSVVLVLLLGLALVVVFAPAIASPFVASVIRDKASAAIRGSVEVGSVELSWFGPQHVDGIRIRDAGENVTDVDVKADVSLLSLALGSRDLGTITVTGSASLRRGEDGTINAIEATSPPASSRAPKSGASAGSPRIPASLRAKLNIDGLSVHYADAVLERRGIKSVAVRSVKGVGTFRPGMPIELELAGVITRDDAGREAGRVQFKAAVDGLVSSTGAIATDAATIDAALTLERVDPALVSPLVDAPIDVVAAAGSDVDVVLAVQGPALRPDASVEISSANVAAEGAVGFDGDALVVRRPIALSLNQHALEAIDPDWLAEATGGSLNVRAMPTIGVSIAELRLPVNGSSLAALAARASVELGAIDAIVRVGEGDSATSRHIATRPATFSLTAETLAGGVEAEGVLSFQVNGKEGGTLTLDLGAADLLDAEGQLRTDQLPALRGRVALEGVDTAVIQPFVAAARINMAREVGAKLSFGMDLKPESGRTVLHGLITSENVNGDIYLALAGTQLVSTEIPTQLRVGTLGPLATRMFDRAGVRVREGASLSLIAQQIGVDLAGLLGGGTLSPSDIVAVAEITIGPTTGVLIDADRARAFSIEQVATVFQFSGPARSAQVRLATGGTIDKRPAGSVVAEFRLDEFVAADGTWTFGMPAVIRGRAELTGVASELLEPFLTLEGTSVEQLVGPAVDLTLEAMPSGQGETRIALELTTEQMTGDGAILLRPDMLVLDAAGFTLTHASLGPTLASVLGSGPEVSIRPFGGVAEVTLQRLMLPLDRETRAPRMAQLDAAARVSLRNVYLDRPGVSDADQFEIRQLLVKPRLKPGEPARIDVNAVCYNRREQFRADGSIDVPGLSAALAGEGSFGLTSLQPGGRVTMPELPPSLLAEGLRYAKLQGVDVDALAADIAGESFAVVAEVKTIEKTIRASIKASGQRLDVEGDIALAGQLESASMRSEVRLSQPSSEQIVRAFLPEMSDAVGIVGATALRLEGTVAGGGAVEARAQIPVMTLSGLEEGNIRVALDASVKTALATPAAPQQPLSLHFELGVQDKNRNPLASAVGDLGTTLGAAATVPLEGHVQARGLRTAWADKLLGSKDLYQGLLGESLGVTGRASIDPAAGATSLAVQIDAPTIRGATEIAATVKSGAVTLDKPVTFTWTGDHAWLSRRLVDALADKAPSIDAPIRAEIDLRALSVPSSTQRVPGVGLEVDATVRVPAADLTMPDGQRRAYRTLLLSARTNSSGTGVDVVLGGDVRVGEADPVRALDLSIAARRLVAAGVLDLEQAFINADGSLTHVPTSLIDAFAGTGGLLADVLGPNVAIEQLKVRRAPLDGGTVALTARSDQASAVIAGTFKAGPAGTYVDGSFVVDEGSYVELTQFRKSYVDKILGVVPIFGNLERDPQSDRPTRIIVQSMSLPLSGKVEQVDFKLLADLGTVRYGLSGVLETALKMAGLRSLGQLGARIQPFDVSMAEGVVRYDRLKVPLGEFDFDSNGSINLLTKTKDLLILMPAGQFGTEAFGVPGLARDMINGLVKIPMSNAGAWANMQWKADFSKAQGELFKPDKLLDEVIRQGIGNLLNKGGEGSGG